MATPADPAVLYPDVAACGSLAAALRSAAQGGLGAVPVASPGFDPLRRAVVASALPHRQPLEISARRHQRCWSVRGAESFQGLSLIDGATEDLAEVARAARAWHGASLGDIHRAAPFVHLTGRFEVPDHDPARLTESEWSSLRIEARELRVSWRESYRALIEAAHAQARLRALYPFTSHLALRFSITTRPRLTAVGPCLTTNSDGTYGVGESLSSDGVTRFTTADQAVAAAVDRLPSGLGLVTLGG